jgi:hypothetical protein
MNVYKAFFSKNEIRHCFYVCDSDSDYSSYFYECEDGKPAYAIIKAEGLMQAYAIAGDILLEAMGKLKAA